MADWLTLSIYAIAALLILLLLYLVYSGLFYPITFRIAKPPFLSKKLTIFYKLHIGPYRNVGGTFKEAFDMLPSGCDMALGIYYDDPSQVKEEECQTAVAVIASEDGVSVSEDVRQRYLKAGFKERELPTLNNAVFSPFPFKNTASIFIGVMRLYPKLHKFIKENKLLCYPMIEVYQKKEERMHLIAPMEHQEDFYMPEIKRREYKCD